MKLICSLPHPDGHVLVARLPADARVVVRFHDADADVLDLTDHVADLVLIGMQVQAERADGTSAAPDVQDEIEAGRVELTGTGWPAPTFVYAHPQSRTVVEASWDDTVAVLELGIVAQLTAGVAAEAAEADMPDTADGAESDAGSVDDDA